MSLSFSAAQVGSIAAGLKVMVVLQWVTLVLFFGFVTVFIWIGLKTWRRFQSLRGRRLIPLLNEGKTIARKTISIGKKIGTRGMTIVGVAVKTAEEVGMRAQTTASVVKGTMPEARRLPGEVSATTNDLKSAVKTADTVRTAARAVRGFQAASRILGSFRSVVKSAQAASKSRPEQGSRINSGSLNEAVPPGAIASKSQAAQGAEAASKNEQEVKL
ncbi:MAG TPA: hypothetical protein VFJ58_03665 [Armatimonadota bacterium]|nr:hypothetical protein [Armatimonadota bacterium]